MLARALLPPELCQGHASVWETPLPRGTAHAALGRGHVTLQSGVLGCEEGAVEKARRWGLLSDPFLPAAFA